MFKKLDEVENKFIGLGRQLEDPSVTSDPARYRTMMKEYSDLEQVVSVYRLLKKAQTELKSSKEILEQEKDPELRELAKEEVSQLEDEIPPLEQRLKVLLIPKDPNDEKNVFLEIRAGAGGDEASLFAEELMRAYSNYAGEHNWTTELMSSSEGNVGGYKEVVARISGDKVFSRLKYESGVHRVQRVPETETQGRVHTSTITVAVLPEAEEVDIQINHADLKVDTYRASGAGGQHVNKTDSAVRITHIPTGVVVACQDERSQMKNRSKAMKILATKLLAAQEEAAAKEKASARSAQIGTGDRSEKVRTYNFPQSRVTDHRIGLTIHQLESVMSGKLDLVIEPLTAFYQAEALKNTGTK